MAPGFRNEIGNQREEWKKQQKEQEQDQQQKRARLEPTPRVVPGTAPEPDPSEHRIPRALPTTRSPPNLQISPKTSKSPPKTSKSTPPSSKSPLPRHLQRGPSALAQGTGCASPRGRSGIGAGHGHTSLATGHLLLSGGLTKSSPNFAIFLRRYLSFSHHPAPPPPFFKSPPGCPARGRRAAAAGFSVEVTRGLRKPRSPRKI